MQKPSVDAGGKIQDAGVIKFEEFKQAFSDAMNDDFNTPQAIAVLFDLSREMNSLLAAGNVSRELLNIANELYIILGGTILGIIPNRVDAGNTGEVSLDAQLMELMIGVRAEARIQKFWSLSDKIRDGLQTIGIALEDKRDGTTWKKIK